MSTVFRPNASQSPDGRLWFANQNVLQMIDPAHLDGNPIPPPVPLVMPSEISGLEFVFCSRRLSRLKVGDLDFAKGYSHSAFGRLTDKERAVNKEHRQRE
jgi:hypothetical protein